MREQQRKIWRWSIQEPDAERSAYRLRCAFPAQIDPGITRFLVWFLHAFNFSACQQTNKIVTRPGYTPCKAVFHSFHA
ncbi:MAG: hypothetical protein Q4C71_06125, partial [Microbacteriaceae bacterium]|nr:hypothetical protein [Microbacteriaceae bacterium]